MSTNLEMNFIDEQGRNKKVTIKKPVLGLTAEEVLPVMQSIVDSDIFKKDGFDSYAAPKNARYVRTEVEEIYEA